MMIASLAASASSPSDAFSVLDQVGLLGRVKGDMTFLRIIFEAFRSQYPVQRDEMRTASTADNFEAVRTVAHSLKGNASTLGGQRVADVAAEIVEECKQYNAAALRELFRRLDHEVAQFEQAMKTLLDH